MIVLILLIVLLILVVTLTSLAEISWAKKEKVTVLVGDKTLFRQRERVLVLLVLSYHSLLNIKMDIEFVIFTYRFVSGGHVRKTNKF